MVYTEENWVPLKEVYQEAIARTEHLRGAALQK
jgi:hypothetical protein